MQIPNATVSGAFLRMSCRFAIAMSSSLGLQEASPFEESGPAACQFPILNQSQDSGHCAQAPTNPIRLPDPTRGIVRARLRK